MKISNGTDEIRILTPKDGSITISSDPNGESLNVDLIVEGERKFYRITMTNPPEETGKKPGLIMQKR